MLAINKIIKILIFSDFLLESGWGLIAPIFAIFITEQIQGGSLVSIGFIVASYWLVKSIVQPFIARFLDSRKEEKDDFKFLVLGMFFSNLIPLAYIFASQVWHILLLETVRGMCMACVIPSWSGIFTRHINKGREAFSWSLESTGIGFAAAFAAAFGATLATFLGFKIVFVLVSFFGLISTLLLFLIRDQLFTKDHFVPRVLSKEKPF